MATKNPTKDRRIELLQHERDEAEREVDAAERTLRDLIAKARDPEHPQVRWSNPDDSPQRRTSEAQRRYLTAQDALSEASQVLALARHEAHRATLLEGIPEWQRDPEVLRLRALVVSLTAQLPELEAAAHTTMLATQERAPSFIEAEARRAAHFEAESALIRTTEQLQAATDALAIAEDAARSAVAAELRALYRATIGALDAALADAAAINTRLVAIQASAALQFPVRGQEGEISPALGLPLYWPELVVDTFGSRLQEWRRRVRALGWLKG
jgi:hypothetical protein